MKSQLMIAAGILLALSTAVATNVNGEAQAVSNASASADLSLQASAQVVSLWKDHANSAASTPLARPL